MNSVSAPQLPSACAQKSGLRRYGVWIVAALAALVALAVPVFGLTWQGVGKVLPFALLLACPAMHFFMCRKPIPGPATDDAGAKVP